MPQRSPHRVRERRTAWWLVAVQFGLLAVIVLIPAGDDWPVGPGLRLVAATLAAVGLALMVVAGLQLGRNLTALPLPTGGARLRTDGLYRVARHPIYTGLLLFCAGLIVGSGSWARLAVLGLLVGWLNVKARWEEGRLAERFPEYPAYAARTGRFTPVRILRRT